MSTNDARKTSGSAGPEGGRGTRPTGGPAENTAKDKGRFSSKRKKEAVLRLLRGEDLEALSRELGVTAAKLTDWRDQFLDGGQAALKSRPTDERDEEIARLKAKVGELTMDNELLQEKAERLENGSPLARRRSRR